MTCVMKVTIDVVRYLPVTCRLNVITHLRLLKFKWMQLTLSRKFIVPIAVLTNRIVLNKWNSRNLNLVVQGVHHGPTSGPICLIFLISSVLHPWSMSNRFSRSANYSLTLKMKQWTAPVQVPPRETVSMQWMPQSLVGFYVLHRFN